MNPEEQLREQRQALNKAINNHDLEAVESFMHPDFVAKGAGGHSLDRQAALKLIEQLLQPALNFHSEVEVESVEVSDDIAKLRVRREESAETGNHGRIAGNLIVAAVFAILAIRVAFGSEQAPMQYWGLLICYGGCFVWFLRRGLCEGQRSIKQTQKAEETWRCVDGRWLLAQEEQVF